MKGRTFILAFVSLVFSMLLVASSASSTTLSELEKALMCVCGCSMTLSSCQCSKADQMRADLASRLEAGATAQEILKSYVAMYGEKVLSSPPKKGFNLTAWIIPFVAIASGLVLLGYVIRRLMRPYGRETPKTGAPSPRESGHMGKRREELQEELKQYI
jgi:cytochrome c-type biogenesis protein CcmH